MLNTATNKLRHCNLLRNALFRPDYAWAKNINPRQRRLVSTTNTVEKKAVNNNNNNDRRGLAFDDALISSSFLLGMIFFLYGLDCEGRKPLLNQLNSQDARDFDEDELTGRRITLTSVQCRQLESNGFLVVDNFLNPQELQNARKSMDCVAKRGVDPGQDDGTLFSAEEKGDKLLRMGPTSNETNVRTDRICWLGHRPQLRSTNADQKVRHKEESGIQKVRLLLRGLASTLDHSDFRGFPTENGDYRIAEQEQQPTNDPWWYSSPIEFLRRRRDTSSQQYYQSKDSWIGVPEMVQVATYYGPRSKDSTALAEEQQQAASFYRPHRDANTESLYDLGLMGYLRSHYLRRRYVTAIVYLNDTEPMIATTTQQTPREAPQNQNAKSPPEDEMQTPARPWEMDDGGQLRLYIGADSQDEDGTSVSPDGKNPDPKRRIVDITPNGGRLILFSSETILHEVRPAFRTRHACTIWLTLN